MKSGRAVSVQFAELDQIAVIIRSPICPKAPGANSAMPAKATPIRPQIRYRPAAARAAAGAVAAAKAKPPAARTTASGP